MSGSTLEGRLDTWVRDEALASLASVVVLQHVRPHVSEKLLGMCPFTQGTGAHGWPQVEPGRGLWRSSRPTHPT
jgi:hypothetical protein